MREILFRGKVAETGEWRYGNFEIRKDANGKRPPAYLIDTMQYCPIGKKVIPETVGQFTGLTDKNGKKIFEGDIVKYTRKNMYAPEASFHKQDLVSLHLVLWDSSVSAFVQRHYSLNEKRIIGKGSAVLYDDRARENIVEVIGNIHDNPELLEVSE